MLLKNKKTGEIGTLIVDGAYNFVTNFAVEDDERNRLGEYNSLAELNEEWEDYEEPKEWWYIDIHGPHKVTNNDEYYQQVKVASKEIGNYFDSREEAEKAVEKLKTLTKLCKKGFEFNSVEMFGSGFIRIEASIPINEKTTLQERSNITDSLYLLFGGEE